MSGCICKPRAEDGLVFPHFDFDMRMLAFWDTDFSRLLELVFNT